MRSILFAACALSVFTSAAVPAPNANGTYTATAYSVEGETASGRTARKGIVAADIDLLPLGTRIRITGAGRYSGEYTVADTGRKISGREIDIYLPNDAEAKRFGKKRVRVKVVARPAPK
jgi:3D (Asp-Asp-Asp) domain-containing protein